jgi:hypothetical protein
MPQPNSVMVAITAGRSTEMDRRRTTAMRAWVGGVMTIVLGLVACARSQDSMVVLSDRIEEEADSLRFAQKADTTLSYPIEAEASWVLIFIPRKGFDGEAAARAGVRDELCDRIVQRSQAWGGAALLVYATPRGTSITRLPGKIDVREQVVLHGEPGKVEITVGLSRVGDQVSISSIATRHL